MKKQHMFVLLFAIALISLSAYFHKSDTFFVPFGIAFIIGFVIIMLTVQIITEENRDFKDRDDLNALTPGMVAFVGFLIYLVMSFPIAMATTNSGIPEVATLAGAIIGCLVSFKLYPKETRLALANPTLSERKK